jgi:hypothetical protein
MIRTILKFATILSLFFSSIAYGDTIDFYEIYYNDSLIYQSDINHCNGSYWDTNNVYHLKNGKPEAVYLDHIYSDDLFKIEYYRDYGMNNDTLVLELQTDSGNVLKQYSLPVDVPEGYREIIIEGNQILAVLKNNKLNSFVFVYYDRIIKRQESNEIRELQSRGVKYKIEEKCQFKLIKIILKKI